ncbi:MAG TPA: hypothetical protein VFI42_04380 [Thermomicrobiaceae bacterium]|nr:hypothetical protein [Thermomicrobiaceae bacterium]
MAELEVLELTAGDAVGVLLSRESTDLDLNLLRFVDGGGVDAHVNSEVDVVVVVLAGAGLLEAAGAAVPLRAERAVLIPKGIERAIHALPGEELVYLSLHRRRQRLMPQPRRRPEPGGA